MKTITPMEVTKHLLSWFGTNWDNQSGAQVYAMTIDLVDKLGALDESKDKQTKSQHNETQDN